MVKVRVYSKETCPYCVMAKNLLAQKGVNNIEEIRIDLLPEERDKMIEITGRMTVPQIFIGETHVGGFDDLAKLNRSGDLDKMLGK
ncbi:glutaredoxin 3 [Aquella oligotrophica]|jgi:glutaredoxin 3|uniref:Glutaredoxin n=1 Tax=Aquella oligotrophica TaxID=2067065 RepID=A0A2I7N434_9NEIS|nr:glutaredoxin 3 [Aquella oligotrophica]AUR51230.1 glutaredoxin 3 [Aquella oligotrophica]